MILQKHIYQATVDAMKAEGREFKGVIFFGLMLTPKGPKVLEYNARFGDPEAQVVLPRLKMTLLTFLMPALMEHLIRLTFSLKTKPVYALSLPVTDILLHTKKARL